MARLLLALLLLLGPGAARAAGLLDLEVDGATGAYAVRVGGDEWFPSGDTFVTTGWQHRSAADGSLKLKAVAAPAAGSDRLGAYNRTEVQWDAGGVPFVTAFRLYGAADLLVFEQFWPAGAAGTGTGDRDGVLSAFPALRARNLTVAGRAAEAGWLAWKGVMVGDAAGGAWHDAASGIPGGLEDSGPTVIFTRDLDTQVVLSPLSNFMAASRSYSSGAHELRYGVMATVNSIPAGYRMEFLLAASRGPANGVNAALVGWGDQLLAYYGKDRAGARTRDVTLGQLGYSTDNGAYYYYATEPGKNYEDTLLDVKRYSEQAGVPYRYVLLDSWWYYKGVGDGVKNWTAMPSVFPRNLTEFYKQSGWPVQGHNRYWASDTTYARKNGGPWDFIVEAQLAIPTEQAFWDFLLADSKQWGLVVYEQDWLYNEFQGLNATLSSATLAREWLVQMGTAAEKNGMAVQYCMSWGRHVLQSVELPAVTNARASDDYAQGRNSQWNIGVSSVFAHAVGLYPSKDNYWSKSEQPNNRYHSSEPYPALQSAVSSLSAGPVAPSDMVGGSDAALILRACMSDGTLIRPDKPAVALDAELLHIAFGPGADTLAGEAWHTYSKLPQGGTWHHLLVPTLPQAASVRPSHLSRDPANWQEAPSWVAYPNGYGKNATEAGSVVPFSEQQPLALAASGPAAFQLWHVAPVFPNGWAVLGEVGKWVRVSADRFAGVLALGDGLTVGIKGVHGEAVAIEFLAPAGGGVVTVRCEIGSSGTSTISLPANTCMG